MFLSLAAYQALLSGEEMGEISTDDCGGGKPMVWDGCAQADQGFAIGLEPQQGRCAFDWQAMNEQLMPDLCAARALLTPCPLP